MGLVYGSTEEDRLPTAVRVASLLLAEVEVASTGEIICIELFEAGLEAGG